MKLFLSLCLVIFFAIDLNAQNREIDSLKKALTVAKDDKSRVFILESLSYAYLSSHPDTALKYALQGLQLAQEIKYPKGEMSCTNALGNVYFNIGEYPKALEKYLQYLEMKEKAKDGGNNAIAYFNLANVYTETNDYRHALMYLTKAKKADEKAKDTAAILYDWYSLGSVYLRMKNADSALYNLNQSHRLAVKINDKNMLGAILNTFGELYLFKEDILQARRYYKLSIPYVVAVADNDVLTANYFGIAKTFQKQGLIDSAIYYSGKAMSAAKKGPFPKHILELSTFLTGVFSKKKQYDSAFYYQQLSTTMKDSLFNIEQMKKVQNMNFEEQQRQKSIEDAKIQYRNKLQLMAVIFVSVIFFGIAIFLWRVNKREQAANALLQQEKEKVESTLVKLTETQAQLIHSEKMASLGELTAGIAHEIQNPLNFVNNFSEVNRELLIELKNELEKENLIDLEEITDDIIANEEKINQHGKRADGIVKGMLQHSSSSTGVKEQTDLNALADEHLRLAYQGMRAKDKSFHALVKTEFDPLLPEIKIIPKDISRVLINLYNNAFFAVNEKKKTAPEDYNPTVLVSTNLVDRDVEIKVVDNGNGIPQQHLDKVFQPFFTTKPTGQGTGLGLSLSYDIVKIHGGEIKIDTKEGQGTTFTVRLPLA
ncbi:MAG: multi-sensor signal transduction histidine kinase [Pedobacter sp.]|jgi:two-component system NtrC family sensor kinase|nr:multi-sensor signal transduction histidine kinase [Pedobacter sp.]